MGKGNSKSALIPLEELTEGEELEEWLEQTRQKLLFRSHSAMHKALAACTELKYSCIHKALTGSRKPQRIRASIKRRLHSWLEKMENGQEIEVDDEYRGVPAEWLQSLLPRLKRKFSTKQDLYRYLAKNTQVSPASIRRYFQADGQVSCAPLDVYKHARKVAFNSRSRMSPDSYLSDDEVSETAQEIAQKLKKAWERWQEEEDKKAEGEYRRLRRMLIATLKEQRSSVPVSV